MDDYTRHYVIDQCKDAILCLARAIGHVANGAHHAALHAFAQAEEDMIRAQQRIDREARESDKCGEKGLAG